MPFTSPAIYKAPKTADGSNDELPAGELQLELQNELPELVPRFVAQVFENIKVGPSPVWMQVELVKAGLRPINNIVDITNYFMYLTGQPLHAYDYDKLAAIDGSQTATITVRHPRPGEKIALLNGKEIEPRAEAIMIASGSKLIGVGGVMGGAETEVDSTTTRIILECANFDMYSIRRTSMAHGLFTDAVSRFNKGQSPLQNDRVVAMVRDELIHQMAALPGKTVHDITSPALEPLLKLDAVHAPVTLNSDFINERLGLKLVSDEIRTLLTNVEFEVQTDGEQLTVKAPFWRTDIEISEDIVEEVGRLYGFDRLPLELPQRSISPTKKNEMLELKQRVRDVLSQAGANEVLNYSFVHGKLLERAGQSPDDAFRLSNALSPDLHYYRLSLTPSLLDKVHPNVKSGYDEFALFEIGKGHVVGQDGDDGLPREFDRLALVYAASHRMTGKQSGAAYYDAKNYLIQLLTALGVRADITFEPLSTDEQDTATAYYAPGRAATVKASGKVLGRIGEYDAKVVRNLKLPARCAGFEIGLEPLGEIASFEPQYIPLSRFPKVEQDICLRVPAETTYAAVYDFVASELHENKPEHTVISLSPVDIYQRPEDPDHKQITLRLSVANYDKTLRDSEVAAMLDAVAAEAKDRLRAERI
jgi:phenylalanyl-tRNA synthetase beta chain